MGHIEVVHIVKRFGKTVAVNDVSFVADDGEFLVLLGPSGCGKTTTLRIIAGLETPDSGRVVIDGEDVTDLPPKDRDIAMVFQNYALYPHMKVYDIIAFPLRLRKYPKNEIDRRVREVAKLLRIEELLDRYPGQLSGGQQQRVALARALVREPKAWLMDEPLSNLDALLRVQMRAELKKLQKELKITTIYVTHDQLEAMTMADRIAVMNKGKIEQLATPAEIYNNPKTLFVAGFVGSPPMNFLDVVLDYAEGRYIIKGNGFTLSIPSDLAKAVADRVSVPVELVLGIRPEHITIAREAEAETIPGKIYVCEPLGSETIVNVKVGDSLVKIRYPGVVNFSLDEEVRLKVDISKIHLFDKKSGIAII